MNRVSRPARAARRGVPSVHPLLRTSTFSLRPLAAAVIATLLGGAGIAHAEEEKMLSTVNVTASAEQQEGMPTKISRLHEPDKRNYSDSRRGYKAVDNVGFGVWVPMVGPQALPQAADNHNRPSDY